MFELIITDDGSKTYRNTEVGATYRSTRGARAESHYVFFEGSKLARNRTTWRVLELGFGTGMNFEVTRQEAEQAGVPLEYVSLEPSPVPPEMWLVEDFWKDALGKPALQSDSTKLTIVQSKWQNYLPAEGSFQAVYHDPFGPGVAPDCWTQECFEWSKRALTEEGILATYGAASAARRAMKKAGFQVGSLPGARGKREMTICSVSADSLSGSKPWKGKV